MRRKVTQRFVACFVFSSGVLTAAPIAPQAPAGQAPTPKEKLAAITKGVAASQAQLRQYEWIETTILSHDGDEVSRQQKRCYYGAEGSIQKVAAGTSKQGKKPSSSTIKYLQEAANLIHAYVPPDSNKLKMAAGAGKVWIQAVNPGKNVVIQFADYVKAGDALRISLDIATDRFLGLTVATYLEDPKDDPIALDVHYGAFPDGTGYLQQITLDAPAKKVKVVIQNGGYRKAAQ